MKKLPNISQKPQTQLIYADLTYLIRKAIFAVYNTLGFGHKENVYQKALEVELTDLKVPFETQKKLPVKFKNKFVGSYQPDLIIDGKVIVELKSLSFLPEQLDSQLLQYLKITGFKLGLLVNFGSSKLFIKRLIWTSRQGSRSVSAENNPSQNQNPRKSVLNPSQSVYKNPRKSMERRSV
ncbi:MAG: GxxExxY protein [Patescibacteria group bacterium]